MRFQQLTKRFPEKNNRLSTMNFSLKVRNECSCVFLPSACVFLYHRRILITQYIDFLLSILWLHLHNKLIECLAYSVDMVKYCVNFSLCVSLSYEFSIKFVQLEPSFSPDEINAFTLSLEHT